MVERSMDVIYLFFMAQVLKDCPWSREATITVQRGGLSTPTKSKWKKNAKEEPTSPRKPPLGAGLFRSKTPTADLYRYINHKPLFSLSILRQLALPPVAPLSSFEVNMEMILFHYALLNEHLML